jgi:aminoglycoside 6-adenylyltransferase
MRQFMTTPHTSYDGLIARFLAWAREQDDLRGVLMLGSRARTDRPADEWSDLDLVLLTTEPQRYLDDDAWLLRFGTPVLTERARRKPLGFSPGG